LSLSPRLLWHLFYTFFQGKFCAYPFGKKKEAVEYSFCTLDF
jgi:hypothetical protein